MTTNDEAIIKGALIDLIDLTYKNTIEINKNDKNKTELLDKQKDELIEQIKEKLFTTEA